MLEKALPGQIVLGDFNTALSSAGASDPAEYATLDFVEKSAVALGELKGLEIAGHRIEDIRCYLTGDKSSDERFGVSRYWVADKHGIRHSLFNAKINIHRQNAEPVFLGLQNRDLAKFSAVHMETLSLDLKP